VTNRISIVVVLALLAVGLVRAQELNCTVNVNVVTLSEEERRTWETFKQDVESYMNSHNWTSNFEGDRIPCTISFNMTGGSSAQIFIQSTRPLYKSGELTTMARFYDDKVEFNYTRGMTLQHGTQYRALETLLDYYAYVILGLDFDSYEPLAGQAMFQMAYQNALVGNASNGAGWGRLVTASGAYSRYGFSEDASGANARTLRDLAFHYHYDVLDQLSTDEQKARAAFAGFIDTLITIKRNSSMIDRSVYFKNFLEAKYAEFAEFGRWFKDNLDLYFQKLRYLDPLHQTFYEEARKKFED